MAAEPLLHSNVAGVPCRRGKVRDVYDLGDRLALVATDRLSAFDWVLPTGIPDKGRILTALTLFWLDYLNVPNHLLSTDLADMGSAFVAQQEALIGRTMLVRKTEVVPVECVVRGYLAGSAWKEYCAGQIVGGISLAPGLEQSQQLSEPIFTPATKEESGHDQNISFSRMMEFTGRPTAEELRRRSIEIYRRAAAYAREKGVLIADTKFEWGRLPSGELILIDEVLTPDSSRFWPADAYRPGGNPPSFDKQFVRDWLETSGWDKNSPPPPLPAEVVQRTRGKYLEALQRLADDELVDVTDADGRVIGPMSRREVGRRRLPHRCTYVLVFNGRGELFIHQRTASKKSFPLCWDVVVGGLPEPGESFDDGARREVAEEVGVVAEPEPLFPFRHSVTGTLVHGMVYRLGHDGPFRLQPEEIARGEFVPLDEIANRVARDPFCPDGLAVLEAFHRRQQA